MSSVKCPDCGRTVSTDALFCPHCGCPGSRIKSKASCQSKIGLIVLGVIIIVAVMNNNDESKSNPAKNEEQTIETITNEVNEAPEIQSMYDNGDIGIDPSSANDMEVITHDTINVNSI